MSRDVAYILGVYPELSESFVRAEVQALRGLGRRVRVLAMFRPAAGADTLEPADAYRPDVRHPAFWAAQLFWLLRAPWRYLAALLGALTAEWPLRRRLFAAHAVACGAWFALRLAHRPPDLVHTHFLDIPAIAGLATARLLRRRLVVTAHAHDLFVRRPGQRFALRHCDHLVVPAVFHQACVAHQFPWFPAERVSVIRCGIDLAAWEGPPREPDTTGCLVVSVGRLVPKKGHRTLVAAVQLLRSRGQAIHCTIIGSGPQEAQLHADLAAGGHGDAIMLAGALPPEQVAAWLRAADIFCLACTHTPDGDRDGLPVALIEAMAAGVPVVTTPVAGIPELVIHLQTGLLVPRDDPPALAAAIARLVEDAGLRARLGAAGHAAVAAMFDRWQTTAQLARLHDRLG